MHSHFGMLVAVFAGTWFYRLPWGGCFFFFFNLLSAEECQRICALSSSFSFPAEADRPLSMGCAGIIHVPSLHVLVSKQKTTRSSTKIRPLSTSHHWHKLGISASYPSCPAHVTPSHQPAEAGKHFLLCQRNREEEKQLLCQKKTNPGGRPGNRFFFFNATLNRDLIQVCLVMKCPYTVC